MLIDRESLRLSATTSLFEGGPHDVGLSIFFVDYAPGTVARLHVHPHPEVFVIESGEATFTIDDEEIRASAGQILIAPANRPHRFRRTGSVSFRSINVVPSGKMAFTWLEDEPTDGQAVMYAAAHSGVHPQLDVRPCDRLASTVSCAWHGRLVDV